MTEHYSCSRFMGHTPKTGFADAMSFDLTVISAEDLPLSRRWSGRPMKVYAEFSLDGAVKKTDVDLAGGTNPRWNFTVRYPITESSAVHKTGENLIVRLLCKRSVRDSLIGEVKICVKSLFDMGLKSVDGLSRNVEGTLNGKLTISYSFGLRNP